MNKNIVLDGNGFKVEEIPSPPPKISYEISVISNNENPEWRILSVIDKGVHSIDLIIENFPADIASMIKAFYDRGEWFSMEIKTGNQPGDKIYEVWMNE